jgi:predicted phage terminase large subunit-like protein
VQAEEQAPEQDQPLFTWRPNPGPQTRFLASSAYEVFYGGAAGPGKSEALLVAPLRWVHLPRFRGILFRRTFPELQRSLIDRSRYLYKGVCPQARYNGQDKEWLFPSGAKIYFGHLEHDSSVQQHQSVEYQFIGFDELTHFTEHQYLYMHTRLRTGGSGAPIRIRAASNPGGPGHEWVFARWGPWLNRDHGQPAGADQTLWFKDGERVPAGTEDALSRCFIPGRLEDNPHVDKADPLYRQRIMQQDVVTRSQLLFGDWMIKPAAGLLFKREWFEFVDKAPPATATVRRWDLAATEPHDGNRDPDWTVGLKMSACEGGFCVEDVVRMRSRPEAVERTIKATAEMDGKQVTIRIPRDPGQAGVAQAQAYARLLEGFDARFDPETGDKETRARPVSAQAESRRIKIVRGPWNEAFIQCLEQFPDGNHDDDVDTLSGAFSALTHGASPNYEDHNENAQRRMITNGTADEWDDE